MKIIHIGINSIATLLLVVLATYSFDVSGTVFEDDSTTIVAGAEIYAYGKGADDANVPPVCVAQTVADQSGNYSVTLDGASQKYYILAKCTDVSTGFGKRIKKWITGPSTTANVYLEVAHDGFTTITGTITNTNGDPVPDAKVVLRSKVSTGGTARFNVDSAVTGSDGTYTMPDAQVMIPETAGEKVASFHISATGYDNGVIDPLEMSGPTMVVDFVLTGGSIDIVCPATNVKGRNMISLVGKNIQVKNLEGPAVMEVYKTNGAQIIKSDINPGKSSIMLKSISKGQILFIRVISQKRTMVHKAVAVF